MTKNDYRDEVMSEMKKCKNCEWFDDGREHCFLLNGLEGATVSANDECKVYDMIEKLQAENKKLAETIEDLKGRLEGLDGAENEIIRLLCLCNDKDKENKKLRSYTLDRVENGY